MSPFPFFSPLSVFIHAPRWFSHSLGCWIKIIWWPPIQFSKLCGLLGCQGTTRALLGRARRGQTGRREAKHRLHRRRRCTANTLRLNIWDKDKDKDKDSVCYIFESLRMSNMAFLPKVSTKYFDQKVSQKFSTDKFPPKTFHQYNDEFAQFTLSS